MAYVSLYRKYRPQSFADVVGQRHVTQTLANAIAEDRLHHAYLFTGPRGTGKTSTARILAKAVNCEQGPTPEPCQECNNCVAITDGSSVDVIELDMASHGGVDDARELRERAMFAPANARKKVYILDEVHMASPAAFNALLKLIEEPPGHVMFAMATTDPQKVIPTIMSRVQRLDLRRVASQDVGAHVTRIASEEGVDIEAGALEGIVRAGDGSVRDTLSILEQVMSFSGESVTADDVSQVLGITPAERTFEAVALLAAQDLAGVLALVQDLLDDGHDLRRFALDLVGYLRDLLVLRVAPDHPDLVEGTAEWRQRAASQSQLLSHDTLLRAVDILAEMIAEMRRGPARLPLELALAKIAAPAAGGDVAALADRVARLEAGAPTRDGAGPDSGAPTDVAGGPGGAREEARRRAAALKDEADEETPAGDGGAPDEAADGGAPDEAADGGAPGEAADDGAPDEAADGGAPDEAEPEGAAADRGEPGALASDESEPAEPEPAEPGPDEAATGATDADEPDAVGEPEPAPQDEVLDLTDATVDAEAPDADADEEPDEPAAADATPPAEPAAEDTPTAPDGDLDLQDVVEAWPRILDSLRDASIRLHAIVQAGTPSRYASGTLTIAFPKRFHAEETAKSSHTETLRGVIETVLGSGPGIRTTVGEAEEAGGAAPDRPRRDEDDAPVSPEEEVAVREAENTDEPDAEEAAGTAEELLREELGAEPLDRDK